MAHLPRQKGTSFLPVVEALKRRPDCRKLVPQELWRYFDDHMLVSGWYPERDYWVFVEALVKVMEKEVGGDIWRGFAKFSALRDIGGKDTRGAGTPSGVYKMFATGDASDPETFFRRALKLWGQYHDTGTLELSGAQVYTNSVFLRLTSFQIPLEGFVRLQGYYLEEYGKLIGIQIDSNVVRSTAKGDPFCEWEYILGPTEKSRAFVASLPSRRGE